MDRFELRTGGVSEGFRVVLRQSPGCNSVQRNPFWRLGIRFCARNDFCVRGGVPPSAQQLAQKNVVERQRFSRPSS